MRVPTRKNDKIPKKKVDALISLAKYKKLEADLYRLKNIIRPQEIEEVKELSTTGDYSENAGYQEAKHRLRRTNSKIERIEDILSRSEIITKNNSGIVEIGSSIEIENNKTRKTYQILGSLETNPSQGLISYQSPLGQALLNRKAGELVKIKTGSTEREYKIIKIF